MLPPSVGCGWHCIWLPAARQCSSRCLAPGWSRAGAVSLAAVPRPGTPPPLCCPLHILEKTSYFKCWKCQTQQVRGQHFRRQQICKIGRYHTVCTCLFTLQCKCCEVYSEPRQALMKYHHVAMVWVVLTVALNLVYMQSKMMCTYLSFLCFLFFGRIWMTIG